MTRAAYVRTLRYAPWCAVAFVFIVSAANAVLVTIA